MNKLFIILGIFIILFAGFQIAYNKPIKNNDSINIYEVCINDYKKSVNNGNIEKALSQEEIECLYGVSQKAEVKE